jgi:cytochrome c5
MTVLVRILAVGGVVAALPLGVLATPGDEIYKARCALCHDGGATQAPRVGQPSDWLRRVEKGRAGLLRSALEGVRDTAMLPRAGFPELSDEDVAAAVDHMLSTLAIAIPQSGKDNRAVRIATPATIRVDDATLVASVAEALRVRVLPRASIEGARIGGITVEARDGRVALRGMVDSAQVIRAAEDATLGVAGVVSVENRLIPADLFEHD